MAIWRSDGPALSAPLRPPAAEFELTLPDAADRRHGIEHVLEALAIAGPATLALDHRAPPGLHAAYSTWRPAVATLCAK